MERSTKTAVSLGSDPSEADLLAKAQKGNLFAFEEIVKRHQRRVYGVAFRILRRHDLADDVVQDTFIRAYQSLGTFQLGRPFAPWVATIAANLALNHVRSPRFREEPLPEAHAEIPVSAPSPLEGVLEAEAASHLQAALARLPAEQRAVFVLRAVEDLSYREIAESLGLPVGTVMSRLARAREKLREALSPYLQAAPRRAEGGEV
jgi:RNA polymerase sigma-70 factor (ECF subfamily)